MFIIKVCDQRGTMVCHLPREVSRITKVIIDHGATVSLWVPEHIIVDHFSSRVGWEFPCKVSVYMCGTCLNLLLLERYKQLSEDLHIEPKEETVLGSFLTSAQEPKRQNAKSKKSRNNAGKKQKPGQQPPSSNDIRNYFGTQQQIVDRENDKEPCIIVID